MTEQQLTRAIIDAVNASGLAYVWRSQAGGLKVKGGYVELAPPGTPDVVGYTTRRHALGPGRFVGLEVKLPKGKLTEAQERFMVSAYGGLLAVVRSVDDAIRLLTGAPLRESTPDNAASPASVARIGQRETSAVGARLARRKR